MLPLALATAWLQGQISVQDFLVIEGVASGGRIPYATDAVQRQVVSTGELWPHEDDTLSGKKWRTVHVESGQDLNVRNPGGAYAFSTVDCPAGAYLLEATGHSMVYVNGVPRAGDVYGFGYVKLPVDLRAGRNTLLFALGRGGLKATLTPMAKKHALNLTDATLPDLRVGKRGDRWIGVIVVNAESAPARGLTIDSVLGNGHKVTTRLPEIGPMTVRKVPVRIRQTGHEPVGDLKVRLALGKGEDSGEISLSVRPKTASYRRTFLSEIDGSVQQYAVQPATKQQPGLALVLSVHGASVECINQANAYSPKSWCDIVCPTNRRPYGFDWEGIGRLDAIEVLRKSIGELQPDLRRIVLTGHSMGGHGTWQLGTTYPGTFAAIAPSAGWQSFYTYVGKPRPPKDDAMAQLFEDACADTDTGRKLANLKGKPIYILHGDADDNVPVTEARGLRDALTKLNINLVGYYEQKGAGHWWDGDASPGADCVDWPPMFAMFQTAKLESDADFKPHRLTPRVWMDVYNHRVAFVYGTRGSVAEQSWAYAKARFDSESFAYRGNGAVDLIPDSRLRDWAISDLRSRSVVLYGSPACNRGYEALGIRGVEAQAGGIQLEGRSYAGDAGLLALRSGPGGQLIGCIAGSSLAGMRTLDRLPIFTSGTAFPDFTVVSPDLLVRGYRGFLAAGFYDAAWQPDVKRSLFP